MRPRASVAVYLLRPFPSAAVRWPPTPLNVVRLSRRLPGYELAAASVSFKSYVHDETQAV